MLNNYMTLSIRNKLIFAFAGLSLFITGIAFAAILYSFRAGFIGYLNELRFGVLTRVHQSFSEQVQTLQQWKKIKTNRHYWHHTLKQSLNRQTDYLQQAPDFLSQPPVRKFSSHNRGSEKKIPTNPRFILLDDKKKVIYGRLKPQNDLLLLPINIEDKTVGYIGLKKLKHINANTDQMFVKQQTRYFIIIALIACLSSLIIAFLLAQWMAAPLQKLSLAMKRLMQRDYEVIFDYRAADEVGALSQAFNQLSRSLSQHEQSQQQWIADISHELRTPLGTLRGELEALQDGIRPLNMEQIHSLYEEVRRMQKIVDDLHQLSLSDLGAMGYQFSNVDLASLVEHVLEYHQTQLEGFSYELNNTCGSKVYADYDRLYQLFRNLLQNSIRYTDKPGRIRVFIEDDSKEYVKISWEDSAPGVNKNHFEKIFKRLYREEKSRNRQQGGSGLGLSICKAVVHAHAGTITAHASSLGGISIQIILPKASI